MTCRVPKFSRLGEHTEHIPCGQLDPPCCRHGQRSPSCPKHNKPVPRAGTNPSPKTLHGSALPTPTLPSGRCGDPERSRDMQEGAGRGKGILTHAPDDPGDPAEPPVPPGHALIGGGGRCLGGCCCWELLILRAHPPPPSGSAPCCPPEPPGVTPSSGQPRGRPLKPGLAVSPCPHAGLAPPGLTMEGGVAAERCQQGLELLHCWLELHCGSPPAAGRALPLMSLALKGCGQSSAARTHQRRHSRAPRDSSGCPRG